MNLLPAFYTSCYIAGFICCYYCDCGCAEHALGLYTHFFSDKHNRINVLVEVPHYKTLIKCAYGKKLLTFSLFFLDSFLAFLYGNSVLPAENYPFQSLENIPYK